MNPTEPEPTPTQPSIATSRGRRFTCFPAAILVFIINEKEEFLLLAHPKRGGGWEMVNGGLEAGETVLEGALREAREEAGPEVRLRPLGTIHVSSFHYDEQVQYMLSISYLMAYEGGKVEPGDDMHGSQYRWWRLDELVDGSADVIVPPNPYWLFTRAVELYRLWKDQDRPLQNPLPDRSEGKRDDRRWGTDGKQLTTDD